jgi:putative transposase
VSVTVNHAKRAFKYRFYPTDAQAVELSRTFGCVRKVYNLALAARTQAWARQERVNYNATSAMLTAWKKTEELVFLNDVSSVPLQQTLRHLQSAFTHFFARRAKYPRFKSRKKSRKSAEYTTSGFRFRDGRLTLAKMAGPLDIVWSRPLPEGAEPSTVTVSQDAAGRWFVSLLCEDPAVKPLPATDEAVGIDVGLDHLLTLSTGRRSPTPGTSAVTAPGSPRPSASCPARPRVTGPTGRRPGARSRRSTRGSPTGAGTCSTS